MSVSSVSTLHEIAEASGSDPRGALLTALGDISHWEIGPRKVLCATYIRPEKTTGGIIRITRSLEEDRFQGKVGLVLALGPLCFDDPKYFGDFRIDVGEWAIFNPSAGWESYQVRDSGRDGVPVRLFDDTQILGKTTEPWRIY